MAEQFYQDKSEQKIQSNIKESFDKNDKYGIRDDQEIHTAAIKTIDQYIAEVQGSKNENRGPRALKEFTDLRNKLVHEHTDLGKSEKWKLMTDNKKIIHDLANRIDNAEREVLSRLELNRGTKKNYDADQEQKKEGKNYFTINNSILNLTQDANKPSIHEVLGKVFKNTTDIFDIDYSTCTNPAIQQKMMSLTGTGKCLISFDAIQKTYVLRDKDGSILKQRALIREGVKIIPSATKKFQAYQLENVLNTARSNDITQGSVISGSIESVKQDPKRKIIIKDIPSGLLKEIETASAKDATVFKDFLTKTEQRLDEIIKDAKTLNYELHTDPVSKMNGFNLKLMEIHLIGGNAEKDVTLWNSKTHIGNEALYDVLDSNESDYQTYLTKRIQQKWQQYDHLTKHENVFLGTSTNKDMPIEDIRKNQVSYGLDMFKKMILNLQKKEGNSWDDDDKEFVAMLKHIDNSMISLKNENNITEKTIQDKIMNPLQSQWKQYYLDSNGATSTTFFDNGFKDIFSGDKKKTIEAIRAFGQGTTFFGNTHTAYLGDEIADHVEISDKTIDQCFQSIGQKLDIGTSDTEASIKDKKALIDSLYNCEDANSIAKLLVNKGILPANLGNNKDIIEKCIELKKRLTEKKESATHIPHTLASLADDQKREKLHLEQKDNKSEDDMIRAQALQYLEEHPEEQAKVNTNVLEGIKDSLRYSGIAHAVKATLAATLVDIGGGAKGKNASTYNDIVGYGNFNVSDEHAEMIGEITKEILITIAVSIVTAGAGGVLLQAGLKAATLATRMLRAETIAMKIVKFANLGKTAFSTLNVAGKIAKVGYTASTLLIEAPVFNSMSKVIHSTLTGREILADMSWSDLNPLKKENIQTAAFLGSLQLVKAGMGVIKIDFLKGFTAFKNSPQGMKAFAKLSKETLAEMGTMMTSEQAINLTFGREIIDPSTGEIRIERGLHMPSTQEVAQMIGMILGMRASAKFNIWPKIEARLKTGEFTILEVKKDDVVIVDNDGNKMKLFTNQEQVKKSIELKKSTQETRQTNTPEQKNINTINRMKTRNAPNKIGTRKVENYKGKTKEAPVVSQPSELFRIKGDLKSAMDHIGITKGNKVSIESKKYQFIGIKEGKAQFVEIGVKDATPKVFENLQSMKDINREMGDKATNAGRQAKYDELYNAKEESIVAVEKDDFVSTTEENLQGAVDKQFNNFYKTPAQKKLDNHNKRYEKQDKFELQVLQTQELIRNQESALNGANKPLSEAMLKLKNAGDILTLSPNDIKRVQREIGTKPDGVRGSESLNRLSSHFDTQLSGNKNHVQTPIESGVKKPELSSSYVDANGELHLNDATSKILFESQLNKSASDIADNMMKKNPSQFESYIAFKTKKFLEWSSKSLSEVKARKDTFVKSAKDLIIALYCRSLSITAFNKDSFLKNWKSLSGSLEAKRILAASSGDAEIVKVIDDLQNNIKSTETKMTGNKNTNTTNSEYFDGKKSRYGFTTGQAQANSKSFDEILGTEPVLVDAGTKTAKVAVDVVAEAKKLIEPILQGKGLLKAGENLSEAQILAIKDAHLNLQGGELGKLTPSQLREKVSTLSEAFPGRSDVVRCLLESGICGSEKFNLESRTLRRQGDQSYIDIANLLDPHNTKALDLLTKYEASVFMIQDGLGEFVMDVNGRSIRGLINKYGAFEYPENFDPHSTTNTDKIVYLKTVPLGDIVMFIDYKASPIELSMSEAKISRVRKNMDIKDKFDVSVFEDGDYIYLLNYEGNKMDKIPGKITSFGSSGKSNQYIETTDTNGSKKILRLRRDNYVSDPLKWVEEISGISMDTRETNALANLEGYIVIKTGHEKYELFEKYTLIKKLTFHDYNNLGNDIELISGFDNEHKTIIKKTR